MAATRKPKNELDEATTRSKLSRLLETETEIAAMLADARREAAEVIEQAHATTETRMRALEEELASSREELERQVANERDDALADVRSTAASAVRSLDGLDEGAVEELARYVLERLVHATSGEDP